VAYLPDMARPPWDIGPVDFARTLQRAKAIDALHGARPVVVVTTIQALMRKIAAPQSGIYEPLRLEVGQTYDLQELSARLIEMGYARSERATDEGIFTLRGDVLHIHPALGATPVRVEFFDDEVEAIKRFVPSTGQMLGSEEAATIHTMQEIDRSIEPTATPIDYVAAGAITILLEPKALFDGATRAWDRLRDATADEQLVRRFYLAPEELDFGENTHLSLFSIAHLTPAGTALKAQRPEVCSTDAKLTAQLRALTSAKFTVVVALPTRRLREKVGELLAREHLAQGVGRGKVMLAESDLIGGYVIDDAKLALITTAEVFPRFSRVQAGQRADLDKVKFKFKPGDYVVHRTYGVALFKQMVTREVDGIERDCLQLEYAMGDTLFTPIDQLDKVSKYVGSESGKPKLTRLGTKSWLRATKKAKESAAKLAFDLIDLYARRAQVSGYEYTADTLEQIEMEALFEYDETPDQLSAIDDVKADMESTKPMDRLVSGDVGYGKTEVAIRAAFKAVQAGKQVMVLCPTTILAQQHFTSFTERFAPFDVAVEVLSRFRTPAQQRRALEGFADGSVDVLIGTHRLLSKDVAPLDLGLLIIDEEHRFGVGHKEQLKNMREQIDVLSLSATPIPRTLQMALSGVRDLSVIDTAPTGRRPVRVHVGPWDEQIVSDAIADELRRDGQVYYVSNRVHSIDAATRRVANAAPEARIGIAHGQMSAEALEEVMEEFAARRIDVLVATTIIESGIDNPHSNTLIIEDSQRLGLAQLYQLKGRVGRSHEHAYAYFLYPEDASLTEEATQRLLAIADNVELGSGMKIALRDLEIRGAGSLLGQEQSGQISAVGFELFVTLIAEAIDELNAPEHD
jgi:transcription-repair coupling factor (superfamily II helicase)